MKFATVEWFQALEARAAQSSEKFRRLGFCDATMGIRIQTGNSNGGDHGFALTFDGYRCTSIKAVDEPEAVADFVLEGDYGAWREMVENIRANRGADLKHTLNYLTLPGDPLRIKAADQLKRDLFFRYNGTLQEFFDGARDVETEFV